MRKLVRSWWESTARWFKLRACELRGHTLGTATARTVNRDGSKTELPGEYEVCMTCMARAIRNGSLKVESAVFGYEAEDR